MIAWVWYQTPMQNVTFLYIDWPPFAWFSILSVGLFAWATRKDKFGP